MLKEGIKPMPFQEEGIKFLFSAPYCILGDEMGLGKTFQALAKICNHKFYKSLKTVIICPAYLRGNWGREIEKLTKFEKVGSNKNFDQYDYLEKTIYVSSYSKLKDIRGLFQKADYVVADEAHYLKNVDSKRSMYFHRYVYEEMPKSLTLMTGTPVENRAVEWYSLFKLINYEPGNPRCDAFIKKFPTKWAYFDHFSNKVKFEVNGRTVVKYKGERNVQNVRHIQRGRYLRRLAEECLDLPDIIIKDVLVSHRDDDNLEQEWSDFVSFNKSIDSAAKASSALAKVPFTAKYVQNLYDELGEPIIVFTDHVQSGEELSKLLGCPFISGATPTERRSVLADEFQKGKHPILVATIGSFSTGYTLTISSNGVFNDESWVPGRNAQARKRIHRIGQNKKCVIHRIFGSFQDLKISKMLEEKEKESMAVL